MLSLQTVRSTTLRVVLAAGAIVWASAARADLIVTGGDNVFMYNVNTGALDAKFGAAQVGSATTEGLTVDVAHNIFVATSSDRSGGGNDQILEYTRTGSFITAVTTNGQGGMFGARAMVLGPDGNLYVANNGGLDVLRYTTTGANLPSAGNSQAIFSGTGNGFTGQPVGLAFQGTTLLVSSANDSTIYKIDSGGTPTAFITDTTRLNGSIGNVTVGPNGNIFVADGGNVYQYNGTTGAFIGTYASGFNSLVGMQWFTNFFGNSLFLADQNNNAVYRWDQNGFAVQFAPQAGNPEGLTSPQFLILDPSSGPEPGTLTLVGICSVLGAAGYRWKRRRQPPAEEAVEPTPSLVS